MAERGGNEAEAARLEASIAEVCGVINAATGRLVELIASVLETESWEGWGIRSPEHWVGWKCGVSAGRARSLVAMARRLDELPVTKAAFVDGELSEDQVKLICRHAPAANDAEVAAFAKEATVTQLRRTLSSYVFEEPKAEDNEGGDDEEARRVSFGYTDEGTWRLSAELPADEGALVEAALHSARDELFAEGEVEKGNQPSAADVSWADALLRMADRSCSPGASARAHRDRHLVLLHVGTEPDVDGHLHLGPAVPDGLRRYMTCDCRVRLVFESGGKPMSVGRSFRTAPDRTRIAVEERDRGCRVPGCDRTKWLHIHHIIHWENGGTTDTSNLAAICTTHHRLHHRGKLGIQGDADRPDGMVFTDERGRQLEPCGKPATPTGPPPPGNWTHPGGEPLDYRWVHFSEPTPSAADRIRVSAQRSAGA